MVVVVGGAEVHLGQLSHRIRIIDLDSLALTIFRSDQTDAMDTFSRQPCGRD